MIKKFSIILITTLALTLNVQAGSDGELLIKKNDEILTIYPTYGMVDVYAKLFEAKQKKTP